MQRLTHLSRVLPSRIRVNAWSILGAAAMLAAPMATSQAQFAVANSTNICGGDSFVFCLAIASAQGTGANAGTFFVTITNEGLHGSNASPYDNLVFTSLGFNGFTTAPSFTSVSGTSFSPSNDLTDLSNFAGNWVGASADPPPSHNGLLFGESVTFAFANTNAQDFPTSSFAVHAQAGPANCSGKMEFSLNQAAPTNPADFISSACGGVPVTSTPEPASLALLATGLSGLGGLALRRRRKA